MEQPNQPAAGEIPPIAPGAMAKPGPVWPRVCGILATIFGVPGVPRGARGMLLLVWQCALPSLFLIWFSRDQVGADVAAWKRAP